MAWSRIHILLAVMALVVLASTVDVSGSDRREGRIERVEHEPSAMVHVPAGTFIRGPTDAQKFDLQAACTKEAPMSAEYMCSAEFLFLDKYSDELIHVDAFEIDRFETTVAEFRACVAESGCELTALVAGDERYLVSEWPMVNVTWQDAADYCAHRGKRLPTEAEWEKAARGTQGALWPWGNQDRADGSNHGKSDDDAVHELLRYRNQRANVWYYIEQFIPDESDGFAYAHAPGALRWSASAFGAYDMAGNVSEWVADYWSREGYTDLSMSNPLRDVAYAPGDDLRSIRGGSWQQARFFGATFLRWAAPGDARDTDIGFRCARSIE